MVRHGNTKDVVSGFLSLPSKLYSEKDCVQDLDTEKEILSGTHVLSHYFDVVPIVSFRDDEPVARCLRVVYHGSDVVYFGFFEAEDEASGLEVLAEVERLSTDMRLKSIVGPVNASFWIGYRFKLDNFDKEVYTAEPYNKQGYAEIVEKAGFEQTDVYYSNYFSIPAASDSSMKCKARLIQFKEKGYSFISPNFLSFNKHLKNIYTLVMSCYRNFPCFSEVTFDEFQVLFGKLRYVLDFRMVKLAYFDNKLVGFFICVPDYGVLSHRSITKSSFMKMMKMKYFSDMRYVLLYLGADSNHLGVGSALAEAVKAQLVKNKAYSIGALMHDKKVTNIFYRELCFDRSSYGLFKKDLI